MYINKALLFGNLTRDPELKALPSGTNVASFGLATNRTYKGTDGNRQEDTQYHNIVVFGRQAENVAQYMKKGSTVFIEGRIQNRSWDAQDGTKRYRSEVVAERVQFGPRSGGSGEGGANIDNKGKQSKGDKKEELATIDYPQEDINPDDIPF